MRDFDWDIVVLSMEMTALAMLAIVSYAAWFENKARDLVGRLCRLCVLATFVALTVECASYLGAYVTLPQGLVASVDFASFLFSYLPMATFAYYLVAIVRERTPDVSWRVAHVVALCGVAEIVALLIGTFVVPGRVFHYTVVAGETSFAFGPWYRWICCARIPVLAGLLAFVWIKGRPLGCHGTAILSSYLLVSLFGESMDAWQPSGYMPSFNMVLEAMAMMFIYISLQSYQTMMKLEDARRLNRAKSKFLFNMSHDIRTPMNAILGFNQLALDALDDPGRLQKYLQKTAAASNHLLTLINDCLDMSRIESGRVPIITAAYDCSAARDEIQMLVSGMAAEKGVTLSFSSAGVRFPKVVADRLHISQVLLNLLTNAIKFTPKGGWVEYRSRDEDVADDPESVMHEFRVKDNGIGMSKEFLAHAFEPFERERTSTVSKLEGTGLGLAITRNLVRLMNGTIEVRSAPGKGTEFIVRLPMKKAPPEAVPAAPAAESRSHAGAQSADSARARILIVDDNEINREIGKELLLSVGFTVEEAKDGDEAVRLVKDAAPGHFGLVLMDIQMPVMDGYAATRAIRASGNSIPIVAMTANAFEEDRKAAFEAGMNEHIAKPIRFETLLATVRRFV